MEINTEISKYVTLHVNSVIPNYLSIFHQRFDVVVIDRRSVIHAARDAVISRFAI